MAGLLDTKPSEIGKSMFKKIGTAAQGAAQSTTQAVKSQVFDTPVKSSADFGKMLETNTTNQQKNPFQQIKPPISAEELQKMSQENVAKDKIHMQATREQLAAEMHQTKYYKPLIERIEQIKEQREKVYTQTHEQEEEKQTTTVQQKQEKDNWFQRFLRVKRSGEGGKNKG